MSRITTERVRTWHAEIAEVGSTTAAQAYRLLHAILATATVEGTYARNPCQIRGASQPDTPKRPLVLREDAKALAEGMPEHLRAMVPLAFWGGLRLGEGLGLQYGDLELDPQAGIGRIHIQRQQQKIKNEAVVGPLKADSIRSVHLPEPAVEALLAHVRDAGLVLPTARLFTREDGNQLRTWDVQRY